MRMEEGGMRTKRGVRSEQAGTHPSSLPSFVVPASSILNPALPLLAAAFSIACATAGTGAAASPAQPAAQARAGGASVATTRPDTGRQPYTSADVRFMSDMIGHHAQALLISRWAPTHDAGPSIRTLAERIINAQEDEIAIMQQWLRDRGHPVPEVHLTATEVHVMVPGGGHAHAMPGMLTDDQMKQLGAARGRDFDRLFLTFMIQHHRGAVSMVQELLGSTGAAQDDIVFKLASDINVDQTTEIDRMQKMLVAMLLEASAR
jgi:uncharacterized protein (DUF305 family)